MRMFYFKWEQNQNVNVPNEKVQVFVFFFFLFFFYWSMLRVLAFKITAEKSLEKSGHQSDQGKELKFTRIKKIQSYQIFPLTLNI